MAVFGVYLSSRCKDGAELDSLLRERFKEVYRVGVEFWLIDVRGDAETVADAMGPVLMPTDKMFVAVLERDVVPVLSNAAHAWLNAPQRGWRPQRGGQGFGEPERGASPFAIAA